MGVLAQLRKTFGTAPPVAITAAEEISGMTPATAFGPGGPMQPYDGYSRTPRGFDYQTGYNIAARPRRNERVSFEALRGLIDRGLLEIVGGEGGPADPYEYRIVRSSTGPPD